VEQVELVDTALVPVAAEVVLVARQEEEEVAALILMPITISVGSLYHRVKMEERLIVINHREKEHQAYYFYK